MPRDDIIIALGAGDKRIRGFQGNFLDGAHPYTPIHKQMHTSPVPHTPNTPPPDY